VSPGGVLIRAEAAAGAADQAARAALGSPWAVRLERYGYAVRGLVYVVVGFLALEPVVEGVGRAAGRAPVGGTPPAGTMDAIGAMPFGAALLLLTAAGLACYGLWGIARAIFDPLHPWRGPTGLLRRAGYLASGLTYAGLVLPAVQLALGARDGWAAQAGPLGPQQLRWASGSPWLAGAAGVWLTGAAVADLYQAWTARFRRELAAWRMRPAQRRLATLAGRAGMGARGAIFALLGAVLLRIAARADAERGLDLGGLGADFVVRTLSAHRAGLLPAGLLAGGLVCLGVYSLCCARWIRPPWWVPAGA
jgi:hypothetical protein